jgi:hypothetical protein
MWCSFAEYIHTGRFGEISSGRRKYGKPPYGRERRQGATRMCKLHPRGLGPATYAAGGRCPPRSGFRAGRENPVSGAEKYRRAVFTPAAARGKPPYLPRPGRPGGGGRPAIPPGISLPHSSPPGRQDETAAGHQQGGTPVAAGRGHAGARQVRRPERDFRDQVTVRAGARLAAGFGPPASGSVAHWAASVTVGSSTSVTSAPSGAAIVFPLPPPTYERKLFLKPHGKFPCATVPGRGCTRAAVMVPPNRPMRARVSSA